jgi:hypothetical protein
MRVGRWPSDEPQPSAWSPSGEQRSCEQWSCERWSCGWSPSGEPPACGPSSDARPPSGEQRSCGRWSCEPSPSGELPSSDARSPWGERRPCGRRSWDEPSRPSYGPASASYGSQPCERRTSGCGVRTPLRDIAKAYGARRRSAVADATCRIRSLSPRFLDTSPRCELLIPYRILSSQMWWIAAPSAGSVRFGAVRRSR